MYLFICVVFVVLTILIIQNSYVLIIKFTLKGNKQSETSLSSIYTSKLWIRRQAVTAKNIKGLCALLDFRHRPPGMTRSLKHPFRPRTGA